MIGLLFAFIGVSLNALSHSAWLISADGPTLFLFFSILQGAKIYTIPDDRVTATTSQLAIAPSGTVSTQA